VKRRKDEKMKIRKKKKHSRVDVNRTRDLTTLATPANPATHPISFQPIPVKPGLSQPSQVKPSLAYQH
jgi:hypothetical protein